MLTMNQGLNLGDKKKQKSAKDKREKTVISSLD
jgi:hypothetical protein